MSTPQDSPRRRKQKARSTKQLAEWREKQASGNGKASGKPNAKPAAKTASEKKKTSKK